jgi:hypothetical protein
METGPTVMRTARVALRVTPAQRRRGVEIRRAPADAWAGLIEFNAVRVARGGQGVFGFAALWRELTDADLGWAPRASAAEGPGLCL